LDIAHLAQPRFRNPARETFHNGVQQALRAATTPGTAPVSIEETAGRAGVDAGVRQVLDQLDQSVRASYSMAEVIRGMGLPVGGSSYDLIKESVDKLGLDSSHFRPSAWMDEPVPPVAVPFQVHESRGHLRHAGTAIASSWFLARGYAVSLPIEPVAYDLVVESDEGLKKVQVKTAAHRGSRNGRTEVQLLCNAYKARQFAPDGPSCGRRTYTADEVDLFFIVTLEKVTYLIPFDVVKGKRSIVLDQKYSKYRV
jgi:hypothetical protein